MVVDPELVGVELACGELVESVEGVVFVVGIRVVVAGGEVACPEPACGELFESVEGVPSPTITVLVTSVA